MTRWQSRFVPKRKVTYLAANAGRVFKNNPPHIGPTEAEHLPSSSIYDITDPYFFPKDKPNKERALKEVKECPESRTRCINEVRQWILEDENMQGAKDDEFILKFLRNCKFDVERTKNKIKKYYATRKSAPELFKNRDGHLKELRDILKLGLFIPMNYDASGRRVVIARLGSYDVKTTNLYDVLKIQFMVVEAILRDAETQICGTVVVADVSGVSLSHCRLFSVGLLKRLVDYWHNVIPLRLKEVYFFSAPFVFDALYRLLKVFLPEKMRNRFKFVSSDLDALHQCIPPKCLPQEYGGSAGNLSGYISSIEMQILELTDWFLDDEKYGLLDDVAKTARNPTEPDSLPPTDIEIY